MRTKIMHSFFLTLIILCYGCSPINYGNTISRSISTAIYMNGYWGEWNTWNSLKVYQGRATINSLESITLYSSSHPSDIDFEVVPEKYLGKDKDWHRYTGIVNVGCFRDKYDGLGEYYQNKIDLSNCIENENKIRFSCEILSSHPINNVVKKRGIINVFYNGVGRGYSFKNY